jgi:hypothetical protein
MSGLLLFTLEASLGAGLLFGAIPVWGFGRPQVAAVLHGGGGTSSQSRETHRSRNVVWHWGRGRVSWCVCSAATGLRRSLAGVAFGPAAAAILMRLMAKLLFEVKPVDPVTYAAVSACLIAAALAASYLPTLRITTMDPVNALRAE